MDLARGVRLCFVPAHTDIAPPPDVTAAGTSPQQELHMSHRSRIHRSSFRLLATATAISLALTAPLTVLAHDASQQKTVAGESSDQPVADSWITTKVKADLLLDEQTKGFDINVGTTNGVVTLAGRLDTRAQVEKAVAIARAIKGVKSVDATTLTIKPAH